MMAFLTLLGGCTVQEISRSLYEGARARDQSLQSTPYGQSSRVPLPSFDEYERERRTLSAPHNVEQEESRETGSIPYR
jgi:hypothetical protein